jgi:hypothetical protein
MIKKKNSNWKKGEQYIDIKYCQFNLLTSDTQYEYYLQHNLQSRKITVDIVDKNNNTTVIPSYRILNDNAIVVYLPSVCFRNYVVMIRA